MTTQQILVALCLSTTPMHGMSEVEIFKLAARAHNDDTQAQAALGKLLAHCYQHTSKKPTSSEKKQPASVNPKMLAHFRLTDCGTGTLQDFEPNAKRYSIIADPQYAHTLFNLAEGFMHNEGHLKNFNFAIALYHAAARQGVVEAQAKVALYYRNKNDFTTSVYWLKKAADQEHPSSLYNLGIYYREGLGVPKKNILAADLFRQAADKGLVQAQYLLGLCYQEGKGVTKNDRMAFNLFQKAAGQEFVPAQYALGHCYEKGYGISPDPVMAKFHYEHAAEKGNKNAIDALRWLE